MSRRLRASGAFVSANRRLVGGLLLTLGICAAAPGLAIAFIELWHGVAHRHPPIWQNIGGAALFVAAGASLIQQRGFLDLRVCDR